MVLENLPLLEHSPPFFPFGGIGVFSNFLGVDFSIVYVVNKGIAWGLFSSLQSYLPYIRILLILGMGWYLWASKLFFRYPWCFVSIITGAVGNVLDYFLYGHVIDMFFIRFWGYAYPVFNIADSAIFCGIVCIAISSFLKKPKVLLSL